jgi:hypothetical protein
MEGLPMVSKISSSFSEINTVINSLASQNPWLKLTKPYRGIILSEDVKIITVNEQRAVFQVFDSKICAALKGCVHLHSPSLPRTVRARIKDNCISKGMFALSDFAYLDSDWQNRLHERVQPKQPTYGFLKYEDFHFRAPMQNISVNGVGVLVSKTADNETELQPDSVIKLDFRVTPEYGWAALKGRIVYLIEVTKSLLRLGIHLQPDVQQGLKLEKYIINRKKEIMEELDQAFLAGITPMGAECQYF